MLEKKYYYDDEDTEVPARETSHPKFLKYCGEDEFYFDLEDGYSPFANAEGADTLTLLEEWYYSNENCDEPIDFLKYVIETEMDYETEHMEVTDRAEILKIFKNDKKDTILVMDNVLIAVSFAQYKISGELNPEFKRLTLIAIDRQKIITQFQLDNIKNKVAEQEDVEEFEYNLYVLDRMKSDLNLFD
ncbi:hypothetical protein FLBR109950_07995 [Flavobacterium branchiophilum]|uniref:Uncharacterized protein n=1 Tax=Flavobacterium branchiophilum (strain FL-15) TaxID=1034807 RepID=G2Z0F4_FLABF|nr:hypothetical protein [Flavobacterium branchiophilum]CCB69345.1 Hypothetical protein FBFL15_1261 [Flavobacterium branchiophilum FL-15]